MKAFTTFVQNLLADVEGNKAIMIALGADEPPFYERYISAMLQQLVEKIDRVREVAGRQLQFFFKDSAFKAVPFALRDDLHALFA